MSTKELGPVTHREPLPAHGPMSAWAGGASGAWGRLLDYGLSWLEVMRPHSTKPMHQFSSSRSRTDSR